MVESHILNGPLADLTLVFLRESSNPEPVVVVVLQLLAVNAVHETHQVFLL